MIKSILENSKVLKNFSPTSNPDAEIKLPNNYFAKKGLTTLSSVHLFAIRGKQKRCCFLNCTREKVVSLHAQGINLQKLILG